jgi:uncharacterized MAPEG superfamily protein
METEIALSLDLRWLVYSVLLALVLWIPYVLSAMSVRGPERLAGYPTGNYADLPDWAQRSYRAHMNLVENLAPFAALVLVAQVVGAASETTAVAAQVFFWARLVQAVVHIAAVPWVRTLAFAVGWIASLVIMWEILM